MHGRRGLKVTGTWSNLQNGQRVEVKLAVPQVGLGAGRADALHPRSADLPAGGREATTTGDATQEIALVFSKREVPLEDEEVRGVIWDSNFADQRRLLTFMSDGSTVGDRHLKHPTLGSFNIPPHFACVNNQSLLSTIIATPDPDTELAVAAEDGTLSEAI